MDGKPEALLGVTQVGAYSLFSAAFKLAHVQRNMQSRDEECGDDETGGIDEKGRASAKEGYQTTDDG